jgi:hypothetical protein
MPHRPTNFRSTVVKPYYTDDTILSNNALATANVPNITGVLNPLAQKRGQGRPLGSKNKQHPTELSAFLTSKEKSDIELSL